MCGDITIWPYIFRTPRTPVQSGADRKEWRMKVTESSRMGFIPSYAFDEIRKTVAELRSRGVDVIDLGVGDPVRPAPDSVRKGCCEGVDMFAAAGYPPYRGVPDLLEAAAAWMKEAFRVDLDPEREVMATIGSKEAIVHFHLGVLDPGDFVLIPSPGYPPYTTGALFAGGRPIFYPLVEGSGFLPDLDFIRKTLDGPPPGGRVRLMWTCYPNAPTGRVASREFYEELLAILEKHNVVLASDEAYADFVYEGERVSPLQLKSEGVIAFYSLSKRSNMTGYRVGWAAGDRRLVGILLRVKTNLDSGTPQFVQRAASAALKDEEATRAMRDEYRTMRDELSQALAGGGLEPCRPQGAIYLWQRVPDSMSSEDFARSLLKPEIGVVGIPGNLIANTLDSGTNPGEGYIRFSLTCLPERMSEVCRRLKQNLKKAP
jgi:LL-diaminopimelate aminotransferase